MDKILRINMRTKSISYDKTPDAYLRTGGRGLIAKILLDEVKPTCEPLGKHNKLIFATGVLTGTNVSSASRLSIGAKSPLTGGIKESNAGGTTAMRIAQLGLKAVIIEDVPDDNKWYYIRIGKESCSIEPADNYVGMGTFEFCEEMVKLYPDCAISCIGPAGERLYLASGIASLDIDKKPNRYSGRGGLGAVMGSKKIKGIVITDKGTVNINNKDGFMKALKEYTALLKDAPSSISYRTLGTSATVRVTHNMSGLPVRNFRTVQFEQIDNLYGETLYKMIEDRGGEGKNSHACMPGCIIQCSNVVPDKDGKTIVSPLEYETIGLLGSNLGIGDLETIARLNAICNDVGIDTIEIGAAIGVAMEAGIAEFGDEKAVFKFMDEIKEGTILGRVLGNGSVVTGKVLGVQKVPALNGQAFAAYNPKTIKGMGISYATSPMGADHTYTPFVKTDKSWVEASMDAKMLMSILDTLGICMFTRAAIGSLISHQLLVDLINGIYGWDVDTEWLIKTAKQTITDEYKFNELAGYSKVNYRMSETFTEGYEKETQERFDIKDEDLDILVNSFL